MCYTMKNNFNHKKTSKNTVFILYVTSLFSYKKGINKIYSTTQTEKKKNKNETSYGVTPVVATGLYITLDESYVTMGKTKRNFFFLLV